MPQDPESDLSNLSEQTKAEMKAGKVALAKHEANTPVPAEPELPPDPEAESEVTPEEGEHMPPPETESEAPTAETKAAPPAFTSPLKKKK
jgi:hypothetical protein